MIRLLSAILPRTMALKLLLALCALLFAGAGPALAQEPEYLLYGGTGQNVFLGCLNCSRFDSRSVWNKLSPYGSEYDGETIWNKLSAYGSPYKSLSPWHPNSFEGPVVKDRDGKTYGKFTRNVHDTERTRVESLLWILDNYDYVISHLDEVRQRY